MLALNHLRTNRFLSRLGFKIRTNLVICWIGLCFVFLIATSVVNGQISYGEALASLTTNRNRMLTQYASERGYSSSCEMWGNMTPSQQGVFLTITDLLGRRSYMSVPRRDYQINGRMTRQDSILNGGSTDCNSGCYLDGSYVDGPECAAQGRCSVEYSRTDYDMVLNHVTKFYAINGGGSSCGGTSNRIFFQADQPLIFNLRNIWFGLPGWRESFDIAGPHQPFTQSRETSAGQPRGQTQEWAWDSEASYLFRENFVNSVLDPNMVEIDIDYNFTHDSNPECYYGGTQGRYLYESFWYNSTLGGSAELDYSPCS